MVNPSEVIVGDNSKHAPPRILQLSQHGIACQRIRRVDDNWAQGVVAMGQVASHFQSRTGIGPLPRPGGNQFQIVVQSNQGHVPQGILLHELNHRLVSFKEDYR